MTSTDQRMLDAFVEGKLDDAEQFILQGADINYTDRWNNCAIFTAAWEGNIKALELCAKYNAIIELEDNNPLCNAAYNGKSESVKWLLEHKANPEFSFRKTGENALHYTICKISEPAERLAIVELLVKAGTDVNQKTNRGAESLCFMRDAFLKAETPLHRAAAYGSSEIIQLLLDAGADASSKDANGDSPISWGSWFLRDAPILRLLLYGDVPGIG